MIFTFSVWAQAYKCLGQKIRSALGTLSKLKERAKDETHTLTFNPSWASALERPQKANKILCPKYINRKVFSDDKK